MAAGLEITDNMGFFGELPWHGLGQAIPDGLSAQQAGELVNILWEVERRAVYQQRGDEYQVIPDSYAVTRCDTDDVLGIVGARYRCQQNTELAGIADSIMQADGASVETCGTLRGGKTVWFLMRCPRADFSVRNAGDSVETYMLVVSSHDGSMPTMIFFTSVRVVCNNTLTGALRGRSKGGTIKVRHTIGQNDRLQAAKAVIQQFDTYNLKFAELARRMADTPFSRESMAALAMQLVAAPAMKKILGKQPKKGKVEAARVQTVGANILDEILSETKNQNAHVGVEVPDDLLSTRAKNGIATLDQLFSAAERGNEGDSAWDALNAVTDYADHFQTRKTTDKSSVGENRASASWFGSGARMKRSALDLILADCASDGINEVANTM